MTVKSLTRLLSGLVKRCLPKCGATPRGACCLCLCRTTLCGVRPRPLTTCVARCTRCRVAMYCWCLRSTIRARLLMLVLFRVTTVWPCLLRRRPNLATTCVKLVELYKTWSRLGVLPAVHTELARHSRCNVLNDRCE